MYTLSDDIVLSIGNASEFTCDKKIQMIYFDPPFNSNRDYTLNATNNTGFSDKWSDEEYESFIKINIDKLYDLLLQCKLNIDYSLHRIIL